MMTQEKKEIVKDVRDTLVNTPEKFFDKVLGIKLWDKQKEILRAITDGNKRIAVRSCHSAGKTFFMGRVPLWFLLAYPHSIVIDTAPTNRQVEYQFWRHLRNAHNTAKIPLGGKLLKTRLELDEDWFAMGFSVKQGEGADVDFSGWHSENILIIVDEASGVNSKVFEAIEGLMAGGNATLLLIGNPTSATGDFADAFKSKSYKKIHISAYDSPNVQTGETQIAGLVTKEWVEDMKDKYGEDSDIFRVRVLGEFPLAEDDTAISIKLIEAAQTTDREMYGEDEMILLDPARFGSDQAAFVYKKGNYAKILEVIEKSSTMELAGKMKRYLTQEFPNARGRIDIIGIGAGIFDRLQEQSDIAERVEGVNVASNAGDKEKYNNLRTEGWFGVRDWLRDAILEPDERWYELAKPRYKIKSNGQVALESKDEMKKRGIPSPNIADALALAFQTPTENLNLMPLFAK